MREPPDRLAADHPDIPLALCTAALALAMVAGACAHRRSAAADNRPVLPSSATLNVTNDNWADIVIYASNGSNRFRLGDLTTGKTAPFEIPASLLGSGTLYVIAHPIGSGRSWASPAIMIGPGHSIIDIRIDSVLSHSIVSVSVEEPGN